MAVTSCKRTLEQIAPDVMHGRIAEAPALSLLCEGAPTVVPVARVKPFAVSAQIVALPALAAITQQVTLQNTSAEDSPALRQINVMDLLLNVTVSDAPFLRSIGGMAGAENTGYYPSPGYRPHEVSFGSASPDGVALAPLRWWGGHRHYELSSGPTGCASSPHLPLLVFGWHTPRGPQGIWVALEWSGRWRIEVCSGTDGRFRLRAGPQVNGLRLAPGETLELPRAHVGVFGGSGAAAPDATNAVRRYIREAVVPTVDGRKPLPYLAYDHWMGIHGDITERLLLRQVDAAADLGLEYFVVDAGWFPYVGATWVESVGSWEHFDLKKLPRGLAPVAEHARRRGLHFGMWFEPERAAVGSDWLKQHPDWYLAAGTPPRYHIDLRRDDVQEGVLEMLSSYVQAFDLRWLRWDHNQMPGAFWDAADPTGKIQFAWIAGLYRVMDALLARHPRLALDLGYRADFASLRRAGTLIMADYAEDRHIVRAMQTGGARALTANYLNGFTYQGARDALLTAEAYKARMAGSLTLGGHIARYTPRQRVALRKLFDAYKSFRHLLMGDFHALTPPPTGPTDRDVVQFSDAATGEMLVLAFAVRGPCRVERFRPQGLNPRRRYEVADPFVRRGRRVVSTGRALMSGGVALSMATDATAAALLRPVA